MEYSTKVETLELMGTVFGMLVSHQFFGFNLAGDNGQGACSADESVVVCWDCLDAWTATVIQCLVERERHSWDGQKFYAEIYAAMLRFCME